MTRELFISSCFAVITPPCARAICCRSRANQILGKICEIQARRGFSVVCWTGAAHVLSSQLIPMSPANMGVYRQTSNTAESFRQLVKSSSTRHFRPCFPLSMHWSFSLFALTELSDMMTKTATMATAKYCQNERGLSNMIFAFGARMKVCGAKEFRGRNLVCFGFAYNFDRGRHCQIRTGSREGTHAHCVFHACRALVILVPSATRLKMGTRMGSGLSSVADMSSDVIGFTEPIISCVLSNNTQHKTGN